MALVLFTFLCANHHKVLLNLFSHENVFIAKTKKLQRNSGAGLVIVREGDEESAFIKCGSRFLSFTSSISKPSFPLQNY